MSQTFPGSGNHNEPTIEFRWTDKGAASEPEILPLRFFAQEAILRGEVHQVGSKPGKKFEAKCDVRVAGLNAELDYAPYAEFNRANGMMLGVTRLTFADDTRREILSAEWKRAGRSPSLTQYAALSAGAGIGPARNYYRVMLGKKSLHAAECFDGGFIGTDFGIEEDLTDQLGDDWRDFNHRYIPVYLAKHPEKTKIGAGLACGFLWTVSKGIKDGDVVLCPDGSGRYRVGEVAGDYYYAPGQILFHRRPVNWTNVYILADDMSDSLRNSARSIGTVSNLSRSGHHLELQKLIGIPVSPPPAPHGTDALVEDPTVFALEKHLQEFLVHNWKSTELGKGYEIHRDDNSDGEQVKADDGYIDILAVSKDKKQLLVVELKKGRASDVVVGQIQRYMGYVLDELAEENQTVHGVIIALEDDQRIRRALRVASNITFYRYEVSFRLFKA